MNEQEFLRRMQEDILDTDCDVSLDSVLEDLTGWDSLGVVSFVALAKTACGRKVDANAVTEAKTLGDLFAFVK